MKILNTILIITALLCIFKLFNLINLSWLWCFIPLWGPIALIIGIIVILLLISIVSAAIMFIFELL